VESAPANIFVEGVRCRQDLIEQFAIHSDLQGFDEAFHLGTNLFKEPPVENHLVVFFIMGLDEQHLLATHLFEPPALVLPEIGSIHFQHRCLAELLASHRNLPN
jgi:hypothetical protein